MLPQTNEVMTVNMKWKSTPQESSRQNIRCDCFLWYLAVVRKLKISTPNGTQH